MEGAELNVKENPSLRSIISEQLAKVTPANSCSNDTQNTQKNDTSWWLKHLKLENASSDNYIITNLVAELAILLNDKIRLEGDIAVLEVENDDYKRKLSETESKYRKENVNMISKIKTLEEEIKMHECNLQQRDLQHLEEDKHYLSQINLFKEQYYTLKEAADTNARDFKKLIQNLEKEVQAVHVDNTELVQQVKLCKMKNMKYKDKIRNLTETVEKLNKVIEVAFEKANVNQNTQTEDIGDMCMEAVNAITNKSFEHEKIISELFFKQLPTDIMEADIFQTNALDGIYNYNRV